MWDLLRPRMEPVCSALTGRFLTIEPLGKSLISFIEWLMHWAEFNLVNGCTKEPDTVDSLRMLRVFSCAFWLCIYYRFFGLSLLWSFYLDMGSWCFLDLGEVYFPRLEWFQLLSIFPVFFWDSYRANISGLLSQRSVKMSSFYSFLLCSVVVIFSTLSSSSLMCFLPHLACSDSF